MSSTETSSTRDQQLSGKPIVFGMLVFASIMVFLFWLYWKLHTAPFEPLQQAIVKEFPDSGPLVQGGQRKMHKGTPRILRVVLKVQFDPNEDERLCEHIYSRIVAISREHQDLSSYEFFELHLFFKPGAEIDAITKTITRPVNDLAEKS